MLFLHSFIQPTLDFTFKFNLSQDSYLSNLWHFIVLMLIKKLHIYFYIIKNVIDLGCI